MSNITIAPTTKAVVQGHGSFYYSCYVTLSDNEKIIIELDFNHYDKKQNKYVPVLEKVQLERLDYSVEDEAIRLTGGTIRGFRKDGALKFRESYIPRQQLANALRQIPDHYHDYARKEYPKELSRLHKELTETINKGLQLS